MTDHRKKSKLKKLKRKCENNALNIITKNKDFAWSSCKKYNNIEKTTKEQRKYFEIIKKTLTVLLNLMSNLQKMIMKSRLPPFAPSSRNR